MTHGQRWLNGTVCGGLLVEYTGPTKIRKRYGTAYKKPAPLAAWELLYRCEECGLVGLLI